MRRRRFLGATLGAVVAAPTALKRKGALNVLFLMTDEQHYRSLSVAGNPYVQTPNMDRLAREGVRFENATCVTPYCSPSRASIITGLYPGLLHPKTDLGMRTVHMLLMVLMITFPFLTTRV